MTAPLPNQGHVPGVVRALKALQFLYDVMPPELRLMLASQVELWAQNAKQQALTQLGRPPEPAPPEAHRQTYTTQGHSRPY